MPTDYQTTPERRLADFRADPRLLVLAAMALVVGTGGAVAAWVLVKLIVLVTNLVWCGAFDTAARPMALAHRGRGWSRRRY